MLTKTKIVVTATLILGTASAALAGDSGENSQGGLVMPGSMVGVNRAYHPGYFAYASKTAKTGNAGKATQHVHGGYTGPEVSDRYPSTGAVRPFTEFERNRFDDFQNHE
jgi:hypothetical protein